MPQVNEENRLDRVNEGIYQMPPEAEQVYIIVPSPDEVQVTVRLRQVDEGGFEIALYATEENGTRKLTPMERPRYVSWRDAREDLDVP